MDKPTIAEDYPDIDEYEIAYVEGLERKLKTAEATITALEADIGFYKCCALSGEQPKDGSEPSALLKQEQE